jgi:hypothetical protein
MIAGMPHLSAPRLVWSVHALLDDLLDLGARQQCGGHVRQGYDIQRPSGASRACYFSCDKLSIRPDLQ